MLAAGPSLLVLLRCCARLQQRGLLKIFARTVSSTLRLYTHMHTTVYAVNTHCYRTLNQLWYRCQYSGQDISMYRTRLSASWISWVVQVPNDKYGTLLLLEFSNILTSIS